MKFTLQVAVHGQAKARQIEQGFINHLTKHHSRYGSDSTESRLMTLALDYANQHGVSVSLVNDTLWLHESWLNVNQLAA